MGQDVLLRMEGICKSRTAPQKAFLTRRTAALHTLFTEMTISVNHPLPNLRSQHTGTAAKSTEIIIPASGFAAGTVMGQEKSGKTE